jgi:chromosome segregation ATPase
VADRKNSEIQSLTGQVTQAQYDVAEKQAIVNSLQAKSQQFSQYLAQADDDQDTTLSNLNTGKDVLSSANALAGSMLAANNKVSQASSGSSDVAAQMAELVNKLILSIEYINRASQLVNKQKANNPLVPDKLIDSMSKAATSANNAIALTLTALQSCYVAEATLLESNNVLALGYEKSAELFKQMGYLWNSQSGVVLMAATAPSSGTNLPGILAMLQQAYDNAKANYNEALTSNNIVTKQLAHAQEELADAQVRLNSYQSGLAAATAAAYAA